jgi:transketolase
LKNIIKTKNLAKNIRKCILEASYNCGVASHIGGALSISDILATIYENLNFSLVRKYDRFILSKGHGFLALLSVLYLKGFVKKKKDLLKFQKNGSEFIAHPIMNKSIGIETSNGSLGQGLSFGVGLALSYKKKFKKNRVLVLVGDGECYEGSVWEAAITATENKLDNLYVIVDCNGHQNDGAINDKMNNHQMKRKWNGFGWNTVSCDGHDIKELLLSLNKKTKNKPTAIIAKTVKGKGVDFMENNNDWHHGRLTKELYEKALKNII